MRLLLVDEEPRQAVEIQKLLREADVGPVQIEHVHRLAPNTQSQAGIDLVLLDLSRASPSSLEKLRQVRNYSPGAPIIVLSGNEDDEFLGWAVREGAQDVLAKSRVTSALLVRSIRYAIERKQAEEALRQERDFAENLIDAAQAVVLLVDLEGRIVRVNRYLEELTGLRQDQIWGQDWITTFLALADQRYMRENMFKVLCGTPVRRVTTTLQSNGKREAMVQWLGRVVEDADGESVGVLFIGHDITDLKQAQDRALQSERLAAIGEMVAGLAHESRNALQRSQACLERLALRVQDRPDLLDLTNRIQAAQDHLHYLYEQVREYAAPIKLSLWRRQLGELVLESWDLLSKEHQGRHAKLEQHSGDLNLNCDVDRFAIVQVFRNVLENALAACSDPVELQVRWSEVTLENEPAIEARFCDNGPGLSDDARDRIFEPFFTTKTRGTGLGMAIGKRIVEAHGGSIAVGEPASGAELIITLPRRNS